MFFCFFVEGKTNQTNQTNMENKGLEAGIKLIKEAYTQTVTTIPTSISNCQFQTEIFT